MCNKTLKSCALLALLFSSINLSSAQSTVIAPPSIGDETKGTPAPNPAQTTAPVRAESVPSASSQETEAERDAPSIFDSPTVTELRRESGQVYRIELDHAVGSKQVIEENDSDGRIESTPNDLEDTPNLPKWKLGSW